MFDLRPGLLCFLALGIGYSRELDTDRDGLSDEFEQALLLRFAPRFHISGADCDVAPAEFHEALSDPKVKARNGTVYGQVFPLKRDGVAGNFIEIHFYHLWSEDCGLTSHALDAESVSALLRADGDERRPEEWLAEFWYAAAHENTLCDVSNGATAIALGALDHGPDVWVSRNKHASFLSRDLCAGGCGGDECDSAQPMRISKLINLGEAGAPMNGANWSTSPSWPLASKMMPRYTSALIGRMPTGNEVALVPGRDVVRGTHTTIKVGGRTYGSLVSANATTETAVAKGARAAVMGIGVAGASTQMSAKHMERSVEAASSSTRKSMKRTFRSIVLRLHSQP
jgi:hypothetical protein